MCGWQPYRVTAVTKGHGFTAAPFFGGALLEVEDRAAAKHLAADDLVVVHLLPAADTTIITGAAAHLTPDTAEQLQVFADLHLADLQRTSPDATYADLIRQRSQIFNHFVMALPKDEQEMGKLDDLVMTTRGMLAVVTGSLFEPERAAEIAVPQLAGNAESSAEDAEPSDGNAEPSAEDAPDAAPTAPAMEAAD